MEDHMRCVRGSSCSVFLLTHSHTCHSEKKHLVWFCDDDSVLSLFSFCVLSHAVTWSSHDEGRCKCTYKQLSRVRLGLEAEKDELNPSHE